ncbi:MAG: phosphatase PAP2 family protein, partial [bacterium]|nr:phosphatase PAP2 family protein [bacterium]
QKTEKQQKTRKKKPFFKALGSDIGRIFTSPLRMKGKDFLIWGGVAAITGLLIANDEKIYADFKTFQSKHDWVDKISPQITKLGEGYASLGLAGAFYLGGVVLKDKKAKETARLTLMTFIHTGLVVQVGKHIFGRQRPSWDPGKDGWNWFEGFTKRYKKYQISHYDAFPSGHTISAFGTATVIATMYKKTVWVPVLSYSLATLCGLSRITEDTHWLSDVFLGAVLGYAIGKFVVKRRNCISKLNIYPIVTTKQVSLNVSYAL